MDKQLEIDDKEELKLIEEGIKRFDEMRIKNYFNAFEFMFRDPFIFCCGGDRKIISILNKNAKLCKKTHPDFTSFTYLLIGYLHNIKGRKILSKRWYGKGLESLCGSTHIKPTKFRKILYSIGDDLKDQEYLKSSSQLCDEIFNCYKKLVI